VLPTSLWREAKREERTESTVTAWGIDAPPLPFYAFPEFTAV
jgi:hypothetical protein